MGTGSQIEHLSGEDFRRHSPRFSPTNISANLLLVEALARTARRIGATPAQVAIAWVAAQGDDVVPLVGARRVTSLAEALGASGVTLDSATLEEIEIAVPKDSAAGARYPEAMLATLDSESAAR